MKKIIIAIFVVIFLPIKSYSLIEVDITRGNLNPLAYSSVRYVN